MFSSTDGTLKPAAPGYPADIARSTSEVEAATNGLGLCASDVQQLVAAETSDQEAAVRFLLGGPRPKLAALRDVLERLEDRLGRDLGAAELIGPLGRLGRRVADIVGAITGLVCGYLVIGGLIEGQSLLLGRSVGPFGLLLFLFVLLVLAIFEALHVAAAMLKIADLGAVAVRYPRAAALHRRFRTDHGLARFLAGRQMVVIVTVFFCSPLSSFPHLTTWPLTAIALPDVMRPLVAVGMPGALFVLWLGQLLPQFLATKHAVALTNSLVVGLAFRLAYMLEGSGLARSGFWLASWDRGGEDIPSSAALRWKQAATEIDGFGNVGLIREWQASSSGTRLSASSSIAIFRPGIASLTDGSMLVPGSPARWVLEASGSNDEGRVTLVPSEYREETLPTGDRRFHKPLMCAVGSFQPGDALQLHLEADYASAVGQDVVHVERPVRFLIFRVVPDASPQSMAAAILRTFAVGDGLGDLTESAWPLRIEPVIGPDGLPVLQHTVDFPSPNTLYVFDWEVDI
jgi:hypothetical protein